MRDLDIKIVVLLGLGAAAFGLVFLLESVALNNVPDENVVYIDTLVGGVDDDEQDEDSVTDNVSLQESFE